MWKKLTLCTLGIALLLFPLSVAFAANYTNPIGTNVAFQDVNDNTWINWNAPIYTTNIIPGGSCGCFNVTSLGLASGGPFQSFGMRSVGGNATIESIGSTTVTVNVTNTVGGSFTKLNFYYNPNLPLAVAIINNSQTKNTTEGSYISGPASCNFACIVSNTNGSITIYNPYSSGKPVEDVIYYLPISNPPSGGGGGCAYVATCYTTTSSISSQSTSSTSSYSSNTSTSSNRFFSDHIFLFGIFSLVTIGAVVAVLMGGGIIGKKSYKKK